MYSMQASDKVRCPYPGVGVGISVSTYPGEISYRVELCCNRWMIKAGMAMGTAMPRLLAAAGGLSWMVKGCSKEEGVMFGSKTAAEVPHSTLVLYSWLV